MGGEVAKYVTKPGGYLELTGEQWCCDDEVLETLHYGLASRRMIAWSRSLSRIRKELGFLGASARQSAPDSYLAVVLRHPDINDALTVSAQSLAPHRRPLFLRDVQRRVRLKIRTRHHQQDMKMRMELTPAADTSRQALGMNA